MKMNVRFPVTTLTLPGRPAVSAERPVLAAFPHLASAGQPSPARIITIHPQDQEAAS